MVSRGFLREVLSLEGMASRGFRREVLNLAWMLIFRMRPRRLWRPGGCLRLCCQAKTRWMSMLSWVTCSTGHGARTALHVAPLGSDTFR